MYFHLVHFLDIAVQKKFYRETKGLCCCDRRVKLELNKVSPELYDLFTCNSNEVVAFKNVVYSYNNHFACTSFGVKYKKELCRNNKSIYTFRVQWQIYHFINPLVSIYENPTYLQLYLNDTKNEISNRLKNLGRSFVNQLWKVDRYFTKIKIKIHTVNFLNH